MGIGVGTIKKVGSSILSSGKATKLGGGAFAIDTAMNLQGGDDLGTSVLKAGVTGALASSNPGLFFLGTSASLVADGYWGLKQFNYQKQQWWNKQYATNNVVGGNYVDTQRVLTMRQASVQAIQGSKMNARSALGGEAKLLNPYATRRY
ncbi:hypothetical protein OCE55_28785 [Bacillus paranthracis]|uniref:hypothetical protein n=1 Tax=Bacillus cereus group TaxID=86661 RepID=UPI001F55F743|nr:MULTISPECIES: hypothetical protein [Bacillus cereus group]MCU5391988.1 hypothetical protein [Bacillus paranthracis]